MVGVVESTAEQPATRNKVSAKTTHIRRIILGITLGIILETKRNAGIAMNLRHNFAYCIEFFSPTIVQTKVKPAKFRPGTVKHPKIKRP
jgi:hypothetical protein